MDAACARQPKPTIDPRFVYRGARRRYVAFPLGGIGTGSLSLTGSGRLIDWSIRNRPAIHQHNGYSHFAIKAERDGKLLDARVLNGPYEGLPTGSPSRRKFDGFGFGANRDSMAGVPHFDDATFIGRFPGRRDRVPPRRLSRAGAHDRVQSVHSAQRTRLVDAGGAVRLRGGERHRRRDRLHDRLHARELWLRQRRPHVSRSDGGLSALHFTSADVDRPPAQRGDLAITTDGDGVEHVDYHVRGQWFDSLSRYWREFAKAGPLARAPLRRAARDGANVAAAGARHARACASASRPARRRACASRSPGTIRSARSTGSTAPSRAIRNMPASRRPGATTTRRNGPIPRASGAEAFRRWDELEAATVGLPRFACSAPRMPPEIIDAVVGHARRPAQRDRHPPRGRRGLGLGGPAHRRGLVRRELHPCLELSAGARLAVSGARAHAARDRVHLQPAAERRPHLPPAPAARLRLRHHRPLRRRPFRRDRSRPIASGGIPATTHG